MMTSISTVSGQALEYARAGLAGGLTLSQISIKSLPNMAAVAVVPEGTAVERALDFRRGGLGRCDLTEVAALLVRAYPAASLVLELPLWRSDDPSISDSDLRILNCGTEVYGTCHLGGSLAGIEKTLSLADPSFMYNAIVLEHKIEFSANTCPVDLVKSGGAWIRALLVGAYDGEGFVFVRDRPSQ